MTNTIEIKITGTNESVAATKSAKDGIDSVGTAAEKATVKLKAEGAEATSLQAKLAVLRAEATRLGDEFKKTGNEDFLKKFDETTSKANKLTQFENDFKKLVPEAKKVGEDVARELTSWGNDTGSSTSKRNSRGFFGNLIADAKTIGADVGKTLSDEAAGAFSGQGIMGKLGTMFKNPVTAPILIGTVVAIAPGLLSAVGAAIQTAAAGGFLAAGLAIAAKDPAVAAGLGVLKRDIGDALKDAASPFKQSMLTAEKQVSDGFMQMMPTLKSAFAAVAPMLAPLVSGLMGFVNEVVKGMASAAKGAGPIFAELKADLPMLGKAVGDFFRMVGQGGQSSAAAFHLIFMAVEGTIELMGVLIRTAALLFDMQLHPSHILKDLAAFTQLQGAADSMGHTLNSTSTSADGMTSAMGAAGSATSAFGDDATFASTSLATLNDVFDKTINRALAQKDATAANTIAMDDLVKTFKENGRTLDENTVKGAKNVQAIDSIISGLEQQRQAAIAAGDGSRAATDKANYAYDIQLGKLQALLTKLLGSASAAKNFMDQFYNKDVVISVHIKTYQTGPTNVQGVTTGGVPRASQGGTAIAFAHGGAVGAASGGLRTGMTWVGEAGPELMDLSGTAGASIHTAGDSRRIARGGGGYAAKQDSNAVIWIVKAGDTTERTRQLVDDIRNYVDIRGGDQSVLGIR